MNIHNRSDITYNHIIENVFNLYNYIFYSFIFELTFRILTCARTPQ